MKHAALLAALMMITLTACDKKPTAETPLTNEELIDAVEADAMAAPAVAIKEMAEEVEETAGEITEEVPTPSDTEGPSTR